MSGHNESNRALACTFPSVAVACLVAACLFFCAACAGSSGSSNSGGNSATASYSANQGGTTGASPSSTRSDSASIDPDYVGTWTGYDIYTMADYEETGSFDNNYVLNDNGDWATLHISANGTASLEGSILGVDLDTDDLTLEYGTTEYLVYDSDGMLFGSLGHTVSGTTDWLILSIPDDEVGMVCYTFFINN